MSKFETPMTRWYWRQVGGTPLRQSVGRSRLRTGGMQPRGRNGLARGDAGGGT